jgi:starch-binding outer membrane protein SusE/F
MKNLLKISILFLSLVTSLVSCDDESVKFTAAPQGEFEFTNTFLVDYALPAENLTNNNIGAVFAFNAADFGIPTNVNYRLESSILGDFTDAMVVPTLSNANNQIEVSIGTLKSLATDYGYVAPNTGILNFRVRAYPGDGTSTVEMFTPKQVLNITLLEAISGGSGIEVASWGIVGSGYNDWGNAGSDAAFYTTSQANVLVSYVTLVNGSIKFRENNTWTNDFGDNGADGTLEAGGADIAVTAGTYKITMDLNNNTYTMEVFSWGIVGSGYNDWGAAGPDARFTYDYVTNTFKVGVQLVDGEIKFRKNNTWTDDFGDTGADGTLEAGGSNITVTGGFYIVTLDLESLTYTIEQADIYGVVGSGYNDWGAAGPDFSFTPLSNNIWVAEIVALVDGEIKFRKNNTWTEDFGDTGANGTLDAGGDNIAVTAGNYRIILNLTDSTYQLNKVN